MFFAIVIKRSQLALFCAVWENKDFLSQNTAAETSNQHQEFLSRLHKNRAHISKNTTDYINFTEKTKFAQKAILISMDISSLYTTIPPPLPPIPKRSLEKAPSID